MKELYNEPMFIQFVEENHQDAWVTEYQLEDMYDDLLDDIYPDLTIAGYEYSTSDALKNVDPTAYRCGLADYSAEDFIEIVQTVNPTRILYLRKDDYDEFCDEYHESLEEE